MRGSGARGIFDGISEDLSSAAWKSHPRAAPEVAGQGQRAGWHKPLPVEETQRVQKRRETTISVGERQPTHTFPHTIRVEARKITPQVETPKGGSKSKTESQGTERWNLNLRRTLTFYFPAEDVQN